MLGSLRPGGSCQLSWATAKVEEEDCALTSAEEDLGREHILVSRPRQLLQCLAHLDLALAVRVDLSGVEEVDAIIPRRLKAILHDVALLCASVREPSAEGEDRDLETGGAQVAKDHVLRVELALYCGHLDGVCGVSWWVEEIDVLLSSLNGVS